MIHPRYLLLCFVSLSIEAASDTRIDTVAGTQAFKQKISDAISLCVSMHQHNYIAVSSKQASVISDDARHILVYFDSYHQKIVQEFVKLYFGQSAMYCS